MKSIDKLLIANRGEIAVRIIRTAREMGIATVAVYSEIDRDALHVRMADEAFLAGPASPAQSYLNIQRLLEIARISNSNAIHPGYGFLAENAEFARAVTDAGIVWVGPHADAIDAMGDKVRARQAMSDAGVPIVPGGTEPLASASDAVAAANEIGLPVALKAAGGGGGKGLKIAHSLEEVPGAFTTAQREAEAYFKNPVIYAERYLVEPKHIELQILADKRGTVLHLGERDCSLQRRHQKLWEEAPATISDRVRAGLREAGVRAAQAIRYDSAGTIEFLVTGDRFYFLEMNTRIQVEHTVTEMVTGLDLIREQIRVARGEPLELTQDAILFRGHAIEGRVNAEDPANNFQPAPGRVIEYREPAGPGVRVDSAAFPGFTISADYDSLIAKLVAWAPARDEAIARMRRAIDEYLIEGVPTTLPILRALCDEPTVQNATYHTGTLESFAANLYRERRERPLSHPDDSGHPDGRKDREATGERPRATARGSNEELVNVEVNDKLYRVRVIDRRAARRPAPRLDHKKRAVAASGDDVSSPMHGSVVELSVREGESVTQGQVVAVVEAMKMMNEIRAHKAGVVHAIFVKSGDTVELNSPLLAIQG